MPYPLCGSGRCGLVGQSAFVDLDLDGRLDMLLLACAGADCGGEGGGDSSALFHARLDRLWGEADTEVFDRIPLKAEGWR